MVGWGEGGEGGGGGGGRDVKSSAQPSPCSVIIKA